MTDDPKPPRVQVGPQEALERTKAIMARGTPAQQLQVVLSAFEETASGKRIGVELNTVEAQLVLDHLKKLRSDNARLTSERVEMEKRRNDALHRAGVAEVELEMVRKQTRGC